MVEGTGLENRHALKGIGGSNPPSPVVLCDTLQNKSVAQDVT